MSIIKRCLKFFCRSDIAVRERYELGDDDIAQRRLMFDKYREDLLARELSNSQAYDKAILTLSSAGFAISVTAIELVTTLKNSDHAYLIVISWWLFFATILISISTFLIGNAAINKQIKLARDYYIEAFIDAEQNTSWLVRFNSILNILAGFTFISAIAVTIVFLTKSVIGAQL